MKKILLSVFVVCGVSSFCMADTIALWTFETSIPTTAGPISPEVGSGVGSAFHSDGAATFSNPSGNISAESYSANTWNVGDYFQFSVSTVGYSDISVAFDIARSTTGPSTVSLNYSTDGSSFTKFGSDFLVLTNGGASGLPAWGTATGSPGYTMSFDLSSVTSLNEAPAVYFRLIDEVAPSSTAGTLRVDNVTIAGVVPEPSTFVLGSFGGLLLINYLRRRR